MQKTNSFVHKALNANFIGLAALLVSTISPSFAEVPIAELGKNVVKLEVAQTKKQIEHGLMERESMPEDHGMVFIFHPKRPVRFWMFNCLMSLDMLFIDNGKIVKIAHSVPPCKSKNPEECPLYPEDGEIAASEVLEVNPGYCERHGVKEGDSIQFKLPGIKTSTAAGAKEKH